MKKIVMFASLLFFLACSQHKNGFEGAKDVLRQQSCQECSSQDKFEARVKGLVYISDIGLQCCLNKRTIDSGIALKKVYLHRIYDLSEDKKFVYDKKGRTYILNEEFNASYYVFLKQELQARGIEVIEEINNSPYVLRLDLSFIDFFSRFTETNLNSELRASLHLKDININKTFILTTKQDVRGFDDIDDVKFYINLLIKQMANKTANLISSL